MMRILIVVVLVLVTIEVAGQNHLVGITGSVNWTNITSSNFLSQTDPRRGVSGGITYEYFLKKSISVGTEVVYIERGFIDDFETPAGVVITSEFNYDYLSIPVKTGFTKFSAGGNMLGFAKAGLVPSFLINAKTTTPAFDMNGEIIGAETTDITSRVSAFDLAGLVEIGGGYKVIDRLWLTASFVYQHSLTSITNTEYFANSEIRHNGMILSMGLKWAIENE